MSSFWTAISGKLADRWLAVSAPALVFWLAVLGAWTYGHGGLHRLGGPVGWLGRQPADVQLALLAAALVAVTLSGLLVGALTLPVLRLLEGYWPPFLGAAARALTDRINAAAAVGQNRWNDLHGRIEGGTATPAERARYARLSQRQRQLPADPAVRMPTRVGNILRAAESRPREKYGLDAVLTWPHLWALLPQTTRGDIAAARRGADAAVAAGIWAAAFLFATFFTWWALPAGAAAVAVAWAWILPGRTAAFGELVEAAYDLNRTALYRALRWPPPRHPDAERAAGALITEYLLRGLDTQQPRFTDPT